MWSTFLLLVTNLMWLPGADQCHVKWQCLARPVFASLQVSGSLTELGVRVSQLPNRTGASGQALWTTRFKSRVEILVWDMWTLIWGELGMDIINPG